MEILHQLISFFGQFAIYIISFLGYPGVFVLMTMESMIIPIPSEAVLPFVGFLVQNGKFNFSLALLFASLGSLVGSLISYYMGLYGGDKLVRRWGKYVFLDESDLTKTELWFRRKGEITIFIARFVPVVRHLISIPAGVGKMDLKKFIFYSVVGATIWNGLLIYVGIILGQNWEELRSYSKYISLLVTIVIILAFAYFVFKHLKDKKKK